MRKPRNEQISAGLPPESRHRSARLARPKSANSGSRRRYSITSSARASSVCGKSRPSALEVLRLIASSNLIGCCTGRSAGAGLAPLRTRPVWPTRPNAPARSSRAATWGSARPRNIFFRFYRRRCLARDSNRIRGCHPEWKSGRPFGRPVFYSLSVDGNIQKPCEERSKTRCSSHVRGVITGVRQIILDCAGYEPFG
jgi:hypothetical protein